MIRPGGPLVCAVGRCLLHDPSATCPEPYVCLSGVGCPDPRCTEIPRP